MQTFGRASRSKKRYRAAIVSLVACRRDTVRILDVAYLCQNPDYPNGCEAVSAVMLARPDGYNTRRQKAEEMRDSTFPRTGHLSRLPDSAAKVHSRRGRFWGTITVK